MSGPGYESWSWSRNPYAPKIPPWLHYFETSFFSGTQVCALSYGTAITRQPLAFPPDFTQGITAALLFKCMIALFCSAKRKQNNIQWLLVAHTTTMFTSLTIGTGIALYLGAIAYIDRREFTLSTGEHYGPTGYLGISNANLIGAVPDISVVLNGWLADGLLLRRCYIIYTMNRWAIVIPCLAYLASFVSGIMYIFEITSGNGLWVWAPPNLGAVYLIVSLGLSTLLTLMIIARLVLHARMIQNVVGTSFTFSVWGGFVITTLVESCALIVVASLSCAIPWIEYSPFMDSSCQVFPAAQVIAPFLLILRVANRTAFGSQDAPLSVASIRFGNQTESVEGDESQPDENPGVAADEQDDPPRVPSLEVENTTEVPPSCGETQRNAENLRVVHRWD